VAKIFVASAFTLYFACFFATTSGSRGVFFYLGLHAQSPLLSELSGKAALAAAFTSFLSSLASLETFTGSALAATLLKTCVELLLAF
jgi:hypothetical protein